VGDAPRGLTQAHNPTTHRQPDAKAGDSTHHPLIDSAVTFARQDQSESRLPVRPSSGISPAILPITRPGQA
jgi:hypothetical protein